MAEEYRWGERIVEEVVGFSHWHVSEPRVGVVVLVERVTRYFSQFCEGLRFAVPPLESGVMSNFPVLVLKGWVSLQRNLGSLEDCLGAAVLFTVLVVRRVYEFVGGEPPSVSSSSK